MVVNLRVLWCKLLTSLDPNSPAYEGRPRGGCNNSSNNEKNIFATYQMLPPFSIKWPLRYLGLWRLFPRWMHANIELRTVYLQGALDTILLVKRNSEPESVVATEEPSSEDQHKSTLSDGGNSIADSICVIILGGGYDPRGANLSTSNGIRRVYELDLPVVIDSKRRLLHRAGFRVINDDDNDEGMDVPMDSDQEGDDRGVRLEGVDLNDDTAVDQVLDKIQQELILFSDRSPDNTVQYDSISKNSATTSTVTTFKRRRNRWSIVVISEAVLMYLQPGKAERVLEGLADRFGGVGGPNEVHFTGASFVFADRLIRSNLIKNESTIIEASSTVANDTEGRGDSGVREWLQKIGWELQELLFKPGATRHLGIATTV
eukprot:CAMPEP_0168213508 /NCGR_PEP_ID=MMETSP0140_2-20121125/4834_1 /TAXON_ID=44445 /ORGANISM="Pseudo-nitzschia australis, Strain 10249 10 AB" /LENGTH=373 /DNA_ID=CAMNT_0008140367 /DNA_START=210 /DNA_END=1331 /DNA_ORIENTATION=-